LLCFRDLLGLKINQGKNTKKCFHRKEDHGNKKSTRKAMRPKLGAHGAARYLCDAMLSHSTLLRLLLLSVFLPVALYHEKTYAIIFPRFTKSTEVKVFSFCGRGQILLLRGLR
jgi:hypothetical protein